LGQVLHAPYPWGALPLSQTIWSAFPSTTGNSCWLAFDACMEARIQASADVVD